MLRCRPANPPSFWSPPNIVILGGVWPASGPNGVEIFPSVKIALAIGVERGPAVVLQRISDLTALEPDENHVSRSAPSCSRREQRE